MKTKTSAKVTTVPPQVGEYISALESDRAKQREEIRVLRDALRYWRDECTFKEPSLSVAQRKTDMALLHRARVFRPSEGSRT